MKVPQGKVKSPSIPLYKRGKILKWFQQVPPFHKGKSNSLPPFSKGGLGGISSQEGYTLVEILIAIAILAFGLMAVATMQIAAIKTNAIASGISQGLTLGQATVEELMNLSYNHLELLDTDGDGTGQDLDNDGVDDDGDNFGLDDTTGADGSAANGRYTTYWNIAVDEPVISSKTIRVIVTWTEKGRNKRINLDFVKTNLS
ncbi:MAG: prepilin-type N-terminal cleavage/methylation domain-containing protein [Syntrophobacteria bacterium]